MIYRCVCSNCKVTFYRKIFHHFYTRAVEHMGISNFTRKCLKNGKESVKPDQVLQYDCPINFDDFSV